MNVRKRGLALLMCICMIFTLLPFSALAETGGDDSVVYGTYGANGWEQLTGEANKSTTSYNDGALQLTKEATPTGNKNEYKIKLQVVTTQTTSTSTVGSAATVLVIDISNSMKICSTCDNDNDILRTYYHSSTCTYYNAWDNRVQAYQTRLAEAKKAAKEFVNKYASSDTGAKRFVSVVLFNYNASVALKWTDVSIDENKTNAIKEIDKIGFDSYSAGGTNLEQGLDKAKTQLGLNTVENANVKYVVALTDGAPTRAGTNSDTSSGSAAINTATANTAKELRKVAKVYTICYGASDELTYSGGPKVEDFLREKIATQPSNENETFAYTANNSAALNTAFSNITNSILNGINAGTVTDGLPAGVTFVDGAPEGFTQNSDGTYNWELKPENAVKNTVGDKTTYTYTIEYMVSLDTTGAVFNEGIYHALNTATTFKTGDETYNFNVPGVKGKAPSYKVTYQYTNTPTGAPNVPTDTNEYKAGDTVTVKPAPTLDGYTFSGWQVASDSPTTPTITDNGQFNMPNGNVVLEGSWTKRTDLSYTVHHYLNGTTERAYPDETVSGQTFNTTVTVNPKEADANYTPVSTDAKQVIITTVTNENEVIFYYYKNVTLTAKSNTVTYNGEEQTVSSFTGAPEGADFSSITVGAQGTNAGTYPANFAGGTVGTVDATGKYIVTKAVNGNLIIKPAEVTITADNKEKFVDEADPEFTYTISGIVEADKDKKVTLTIIREKVGTPEGEQAGSYSIIPKDASIEGSNNYTFKYVNGTLTIKERNAIKVTLTAKKYLDGELAKTQFEFVLKDKDNIIIQTKYNNENGIVSFDQLTFAEAGNHIYYISEVAGDKTSINYDKTVYKVTVHVTLNAATGNYDSAVAYSKLLDDGAPAPTTNNEAVFNNTTKPTGSLTISKTVSGNAASTTKEFTFIVKLIPNSDTTNNNIIYGNVTNVTVIDDEISFKLKAGDSKTINGLPDGIRYTVQELDSNGYTVSAKVNDDPVQLENNMLEGTIAAGVETKIVFNNHKSYVYPPNPPIMDEIIVEITGNSDSVVYDGTEHSVKGYTVKISDPRYTEADFTFTGKAEASGVNAGTYEMGLKAEQFKNTNARFTNVKFVIKADGVLTITPKELTITAGSKTEYGPTPVTCGEWTVSGLAAGDKVESVKITGIQSVPGSSPNVPSDAVIKNAKGEDVTKNYAIKYVNGTLTMLEVLNKEDHFNYIIGTPEGLSLPTANVTRAEVATIFFRLMTDDARAKFDSLDNNFSDVAKGKWYNRAISTLANAGIIKGDPAGTYRPGDPITRAEMAAIIARFGDFKEGGKTFNDISGHWAQKYIELAASNGWINGNPDGTFKPNNNITRAETVAMINRVLDRQTKDVSDLLPVAQMTNWSDNMDTAKWYYRDMQEATNNHKAERVGNSIYEKWTEKLPDIDWASYQI